MKSNTYTRSAIIAAACSALLAVAACGKSEQPAANGESTEVATAVAESPDAQQKYGSYAEGFNELIGTFGVAYQYETYQKQNIASAQPSATINFPANITLLERGLAKIKEGRALNGGNSAAAADAAADKLIQNGEALVAKVKELAPYYETRGYREDALAKGKAAHADLVAAYEGTLAAIDELDTILTEQNRARNAKNIADLRKAGEDNAANLVEASSEAELLVSHALAGKIAEADAVLPKLEAALTKLRDSHAKMSDSDMSKMHYSMTTDALTSLVGSYRDFKQSPSDSNKDALLRNYNQSVEASNRVELPA